MLFNRNSTRDLSTERDFRTAYLGECMSRGRSNIAFSDFCEKTRALYWELLRRNHSAAERILPEMNSDFYSLHERNLENDRILRDAVALHARRAYETMEFRPTVLHFIFDEQGRLLFLQSPKAVETGSGNWNLLQGGIGEGEDIISASRREICTEECQSIPATALSHYRFLGAADIDFAHGRKTRDGFTRGKRYIAVSVKYSGSSDIEVNPEKIARYKWVDPKCIPAFLATMREEKQRLLVEKLLLISGTRAAIAGLAA